MDLVKLVQDQYIEKKDMPDFNAGDTTEYTNGVASSPLPVRAVRISDGVPAWSVG